MTTLVHAGVKGMKWGVRKDDKKSSSKSAHRVRLESDYLKEGSTQSEAESKAARRIRTEKVLLAVGATAATAALTYGVSRHIGKQYVGVVLEKGSSLNYVNALGDKADFNRRLYTTFDKRDTAKYKGLLATALRKNAPNTTIYDTVLKTTEQIKAPSQREAAKIFSEFKKTKGSNGSLLGNYRSFNQGLVQESRAGKEFMDFMRSKGYNAILDANDQFMSGYNTKKPLILFNAQSSAVKTGQTIIEKKFSDKLARKQMGAIVVKGLAKSYGVYGAIGAAMVAKNKSSDTKARYDAVEAYLKRHPDSEKTHAEIFKDLEKNQKGGYTYRS